MKPHAPGTTATRRRKGAAAGTAAEGTSNISGTTDATSGETTTTEGIGPTTTTNPTRRRRGPKDAPADDGEGEKGDVPGYTPTPEDLRLREVYGDWVHGNPGTHLDGGISEDGRWQKWWRDLAVMPPPLPHPFVCKSAVQMCARVTMNPVSVDLPET